jgi:murein DD-endopeptidase MepM/ murein hydrolase activator NlpD
MRLLPVALAMAVCVSIGGLGLGGWQNPANGQLTPIPGYGPASSPVPANKPMEPALKPLVPQGKSSEADFPELKTTPAKSSGLKTHQAKSETVTEEHEPQPDEPVLSTTGLLVPSSVKQGNVLKVYLTDSARLSGKGGRLKAEFAGRQATFFPQKEGGALALIPVSVFQKTGSYPLTVENSAGEEAVKSLKISVVSAHFRTQNVSVSKSTEGLQPLPGEMEAIQALKERVSSVRYWDNAFINPTPDCQNSPFGVLRLHNGVPTGDYHKGVDTRSPMGRPIKAINNGVVEIAKMYRLHGGTVGLDHGQGIGSIYIHMSKLNVVPGQQVKKGDVIGYVGSTGFATGPHLHWGMYVSGLPVNPNQWLPPVTRCN